MFELKTKVAEYLSLITGRINALPANGGLAASVDGGGGLELAAVRPVSVLAVGDTPTEVAQLKTTETHVMDSRSGTIWVKTGGDWASHVYSGEDVRLRPGTFCVSFPNNRMYHYGTDLTLTRVSLTPAPTPI